jgi:hypothetical protein
MTGKFITNHRAEQRETMLKRSDDYPLGCMKCINIRGVAKIKGRFQAFFTAQIAFPHQKQDR